MILIRIYDEYERMKSSIRTVVMRDKRKASYKDRNA